MPRPSLASVTDPGVTALPSRLEPEAGLSQEEAALWRAVVATKPVDWFQHDSAPLLGEYVRAATMCKKLAALIACATDEELKSLLDMRDKESRRLATLGCKLRLTQQSRYTPRASATADKKAGEARPWDKTG